MKVSGVRAVALGPARAILPPSKTGKLSSNHRWCCAPLAVRLPIASHSPGQAAVMLITWCASRVMPAASERPLAGHHARPNWCGRVTAWCVSSSEPTAG